MTDDPVVDTRPERERVIVEGDPTPPVVVRRRVDDTPVTVGPRPVNTGRRPTVA